VSADLDAAREQRLRLAVRHAFAARDGDRAEFRRLCGQIVDAYFELEPARRRSARRCSMCGTRFRWPGELTEHLRNVHGVWAAA
jgi:hypothetical protein